MATERDAVDPQEVDAIVEALLRTNEPPSDKQRHQITVRLQTLRDGAQCMAGQSSSQEGLSQDVQKCRRAVEDYQLALSCVRSLPDEIWHAIFESGMSGSWSPDDIYLQLLCSICRGWRDLAFSHCILWTNLPPVCHPKVFGMDIGLISLMIITRNEAVVLQRYLSRSGAAPISLSFQIFSQAWEDPYAKAVIQDTLLPLLVDQCHRWKSIFINLPEQAYDEWLHPVSGKLRMLHSATLCVGPNSSSGEAQPGEPNTRTGRINCFKEAPMLRNVEVFTTPFTGATLTVVLPFSQLENFKLISGPDTCCEDLLTSRPPHLRLLDIASSTAGYPSLSKSLPVSLFPNLNHLKLFATEQTLSIFHILDILVLPALSTLQINGQFGFDSARPLFGKILLLIQRSGCSMMNLTVSAPLDTQQEEFYETLKLSPGIQHLEVPHIGAQGLRELVLDTGDVPPSGRHQLIPNLRVLKLCWYGSDPSNPTTGEIEFTALREMVVSRTTGGRMSLKQVHFAGYHNSNQNPQLDAQWNPTAMNPEVTLAALAWSFEKSLIHFYEYHFWRYSDDPFERFEYEHDRADANLHEKLDQEMRNLENVDLSDHADTLVLARRNIPYLLHKVSQMGEGTVPGDDRFAFRVRAGEVCRKWKPFILRDARAAWYIWRCVNVKIRHFVLLCRPVYEDEEDTWKDITIVSYYDL